LAFEAPPARTPDSHAVAGFAVVPEGKVAKNRLHLDIQVAPSKRAELVAQLTALGGTAVASYPRFTVMADPEGNELCVTEHDDLVGDDPGQA
jgi:hypothetical protein